MSFPGRTPLILLLLFFFTVASYGKMSKSVKSLQDPYSRYRHHDMKKNIVCSYDDKIVGGSYVKNLTDRPYQVSIMKLPSAGAWYRRFQHVCGGCLLTLNFVFTACHCVADIPRKKPGPGVLNTPLDDYLFVAGTLNIKKRENTSQEGRAVSIHIHPKCGNKRQIVYDLALIKMNRSFIQTPFVKPVKMYTWEKEKFQNLLGRMIRSKHKPKCTVAGWGKVRSGKFSKLLLSDRLKIVRMYPMRDDRCHRSWIGFAPKAYKRFNFWKHGQICVLNAMLDSSDCVGDSGSPFVCSNYLIAVVSYGTPGCAAEDPSVYTTIAELIPWVKANFTSEIDTTEPHLVKIKPVTVQQAQRHQNTERSHVEPTKIVTTVNAKQQATSPNPLLVMTVFFWI